MVKPITAKQLSILKIVGKHPGAEKERLLALAGVTEADLKYLEENDMIREREAGRYRIAHFGELVLQRSN